MDNLITTPPVRHRELFSGGIFSKDRQAKASYTVQDIWNYAHLLFLGQKQPSPAISNKEYREARRQQLLSDVGPIPSKYQEILLEYVKLNGLEVVLMAVEDCYSQDTERFPPVEDLEKYLRDAKASFARQAHAHRIEN